MKEFTELVKTGCVNVPKVGVSIKLTEDASEALQLAGDFLQTPALENNLLLSILRERMVRPRKARYWVAHLDGAARGVVIQSPMDSLAVLSSMPEAVVSPLVAAVAQAAPELVGVTGVAATAARFAGAWTEVCSSAATSGGVRRLYCLNELRPPFAVQGRLRAASSNDLDILTKWAVDMMAEFQIPFPNPRAMVERRFVAGEVWVWDDERPVSMTMNTPKVGGVSRVHNVYTPPELRGHGYASAAVAEVSRKILECGATAMLYTDLSNPISNRIYRRIGYQAIAEVLDYRFDQPTKD